jgi:hypothetical protein
MLRHHQYVSGFPQSSMDPAKPRMVSVLWALYARLPVVDTVCRLGKARLRSHFGAVLGTDCCGLMMKAGIWILFLQLCKVVVAAPETLEEHTEGHPLELPP